MNRSIILAGRLKEVFMDGKWIANTNYHDILRPVDLQQATKKISNLNSIAALTYHINYYLDGLIQVLNGGPLTISDKYSFDLPHLHTEEEWQTLKNKFFINATLFIEKVALLNDEVLNSNFIDEKYGTYERNIEAVIEHSYYHLGQISLLKKILERTFST